LSVPIATPSQTIGPYWHLIEYPEFADLTRFGASGEKVVLTGRVFDGDAAPVPDACVELWQASPEADDTFPGYGRAATDTDGRYRFTTLKPGPVPGRGNALQAPHFAINILGRGILTRLYTRAYFAGEKLNETDPLLSMIDDPARRSTLIARPEGAGTWRMDIRLQGEGETVFIAI
jgi:protocatechuate 3,4-dioxygenase alpha subunit